MYFIQLFICRPSVSTVSEDARFAPRTLALPVWRSNHSDRSHPLRMRSMQTFPRVKLTSIPTRSQVSFAKYPGLVVFLSVLLLSGRTNRGENTPISWSGTPHISPSLYIYGRVSSSALCFIQETGNRIVSYTYIYNFGNVYNYKQGWNSLNEFISEVFNKCNNYL